MEAGYGWCNEKFMDGHREPDWKKKGASYNHCTDVHLRAGLRCVDCHVTGRKASDPRTYMKNLYKMWSGYMKDPRKNWPALSVITVDGERWLDLKFQPEPWPFSYYGTDKK